MIRRFARVGTFALMTAALGGHILAAQAPAAAATSVVTTSVVTTSVVTAGSPEEKIASYVKQTLQGWTSAGAVDLMRGHYAQLRLIDANGRWAAPELEAISDFLLPSDLDQQKIYAFIDVMTASAAANGYLHDFLVQAKEEDFPLFRAKLAAGGNQMLPDMIAYAVVQDRLSKAMREDYTLMSTCETIWKKARNEANIWKYMEAFEFAKLFSIEIPAIEEFIKIHKSGAVPPNFLRAALPVNIMEACLEDLRKHHPENARSGWSLLVNRPGDPENSKTGSGPAHWSEDGKAIHVALPLARHWDDLYSTWNLAFVAQRENGPYLMMKLLTPQVGSYENNPQEYLYNRVLALYTHMHWALLRRADDAKSGKTEMDWSMDEPILHLWGAANRDSGRKYDDELVAADPTWINWLKDLDSKFHSSK